MGECRPFSACGCAVASDVFYYDVLLTGKLQELREQLELFKLHLSSVCPCRKPASQLRMHESLMMGFAARSLVTACTMPVSVIKTRYESGRYSYRTVLQAARDTLTKEGFRGECGRSSGLSVDASDCFSSHRALPRLAGNCTP